MEEEVIFVSTEDEVQSDEEPKTNVHKTGHDCETTSNTVHLKVSESVWKYLTRSKKFSDALDSVLSQNEIVCELEADTVSIKGQDEDKLLRTKKQLEELIEEYQLDTTTFIIPHLKSDVHSRVISFLDGHDMPDEISYCLHSPTNRICLTGKKKQIEDCLGVLQEIYGVTGALPHLNGESFETTGMLDSIVTSNVADGLVDRKPDPLGASAELLTADDTICNQDSLDVVEIQDGDLIANEKIWMYIEKCYSENIRQIKEKEKLNVLIEPLDCAEEIDGRVRITFTGPDESSIRSSILETKSVMERCQAAGVRNLQVPCPDVAVHQRITKLLKSINRQPCHVSMQPELITITGTRKEIESCLEKLKIYGLQCEAPIGHCKDVEPAFFNDSKPDHTMSTDFEPDDDSLRHHYEHFRQLPVPIEEDLWFYIDNRCRQQLDDLKEVYNLQMTPDRTSTPGFVNITLASHNADMLDCGQDAVIALILQLRQQIVLGVMNTSSLEDLPPGLQGMLQQQFHSMDSVVILKGNKIITIGPIHEATKSQQIVSAFMQNFIADARSIGHDTSKFEGLKECASSNELMTNTSGDLENSHYYEKCSNDVTRYDRHIGTNEQRPEVFAGDLVGAKEEQEALRSDKSYDQLKNNNLSPCSVDSDFNCERITSSRCNDVRMEEKLKICSSCNHDSRNSTIRDDQSCEHFYCVSCICRQFGEWKCPICNKGESTRNRTISQPENGTMLITYDNAFKLPGFENNSRGTIVVTYAFPSGIQSDELPNPGQFYPSFTATTFFPLCREGSSIVDLLQKAFESRLVFRMSQSKDESNGKIVWNEIHHKVNIYGGFQQKGYPDPNFLKQILNDLAAKGFCDQEHRRKNSGFCAPRK